MGGVCSHIRRQAKFPARLERPKSDLVRHDGHAMVRVFFAIIMLKDLKQRPRGGRQTYSSAKSLSDQESHHSR